MIIKVIPNMIGSSVEERVTGLSDYIHHPKQTRAHHLSEYIHYAISEKGESVWIAQREGRAKNSDDRTQDSLLKMLALFVGSPSILSSG